MEYRKECRCDDGSRKCDGMPHFTGAIPLPRPRASYTPFFAGEGKDRPCVVVLPGGCYGFKAAHEGAPVAEWLNGLGISALVLDYGTPPLRPSDPLDDLRCLIRLMRQNASAWGIDPGRIGVIGFSAGGHLAASLAVGYDEGLPSADDPLLRRSCRPDAVILCYPVLDFERYGHRQSESNLFQGASTEELRRDYSVRNGVPEGMPPAFIWHTMEDESVSAIGSIELTEILASRGVPVELHIYLKGAHGLGLAREVPSLRPWTEACANWLAALGFKEESAS
jgi:acetyl esterase/lipase